MSCSALLNAAQVKLGRRDARLLIDLGTVAHEHARPYLSDEVTKQIDQVLGQLRLGQVSAEGHASRRGEPEENDLDRVATPPSAGAAQSPAWPGVRQAVGSWALIRISAAHRTPTDGRA